MRPEITIQEKERLIEERKREIRKSFEEMQPFTDSSRIPDLPFDDEDKYYVNRFIELGAIPKKDLVDGTWYFGKTRNARLAKYEAKKNAMGHYRYKFGWMWDYVNHFEDDNGYALFVPIRLATADEIESVNKISKEIEDKK